MGESAAVPGGAPHVPPSRRSSPSLGSVAPVVPFCAEGRGCVVAGPAAVINGFGCWQGQSDQGVFSEDPGVSLERLTGTQGKQVVKNEAHKSKSQRFYYGRSLQALNNRFQDFLVYW